MSFRFTAFISRNKCNLQSTSRQNDPLFCLMISIWGVYATQFVFFISTTYPPSSEARASSCFDFFFFFACSRFIFPFGGHLSTFIQLPVGTSDWSDAACCQSLRQCVLCQISHLFFCLSCLGLTWCCSCISLQ